MGARLYRLLLRLLPRGFREEFADSIAEDAAIRARERTSTGASRAVYWLRESAGLLRVIVTERAGTARAPTATDSRRGMTSMETLRRELRHAARRLLRAPGFATTALLTLALALGSVITIWAVVKNVVVDPLPYADSDGLVMLQHGLPGVGAPSGVGTTNGLYALYRDAARTLESAALTQQRQMTLTGVGDAERLPASAATPGLLRVLRMQPLLGRWFGEDAGREGGPREVVLSHAAWTTRFGSDPDILGRAIELSGEPWQVIGVAPRGLAYPDADVMLWVPLEEPAVADGLGGFNYTGIARLAAGADVEALRGELNSLIAGLPQRFPDSEFAQNLLNDARLNSLPVTLKELTVGGVARTMWVLLATVALVLMVACANVANLMLVRSDARQTELAVRRALGASGGGIAGLYFAESALLTLAGGALGTALAAVGVSILRTRAPEQLPRVAEISIDGGVLAVGLLASVAVGSVLGLVPLLRRGAGLAQGVHEAGRRTTAGGDRVRARGLLMTTQVALACVLLVACGLMVRSFVHLTRVDPGFDATNVLTFAVSLPGARYETRADALLFHDALRSRVAGMPGVRAAEIVSCAPLAGWCYGDPLAVEGRETTATPPIVAMRRAGTGYFEMLGVPVRAGRAFGDADGGQPVAVINRELARQYFPGTDPVGARMRLFGSEGTWMTVIGVVENTAAFSVTESSPAPQVFFPHGSLPDEIGISQHVFTYIVRTEGEPAAVVPAVRAVLREMDGSVALAHVETLERAVTDSGARIAFTMVLLSIAAITAVLLGAVGIYGVLSYSVARRTGEIGVRLALGASPSDVVRMVVRQGGAATLAGLVIGVAGALAFARFMDAILFGVGAADPLTFVAVPLLLAILALAASWIPARRAAALDPVSALRAD